MGLHMKSNWGGEAEDDSTSDVSICHFSVTFLRGWGRYKWYVWSVYNLIEL